MLLQTNTETIYRELEKKIIELEYKPGQVITEQEICDKYGISRTPCRDIFKNLKHKNLITSIPFKSSYVSLLNMDIIRQSIYMRIAIEYMIIRNIMRNINEKFIAKLEYNLKLQEILLKSEFKIDEFYNLDCEFHQLWFEETGKKFIWNQIEKAQIDYKRFRMLDIVEVKDFSAIYEDHKKLVEIIKSGKENELEEMLTKHLNSGAMRLKDKIHEDFSEYFIKY